MPRTRAFTAPVCRGLAGPPVPLAVAMAVTIAVLGPAACNGDASRPRADAAGPHADAAAVEPSAPLDADLDESVVDAGPPRSDVVYPGDVERQYDLPGQALPPGVPAAVRVVPGDVRLIGWERTSCSNQVPASGNLDRWCGFRRPSSVAGKTELWVVNVSAAVRGTPAPCDGTSANCLKMTDDLWTREAITGPFQTLAHKFDGDTLVFTAGGTSGEEAPYRGPIWAWRPGWPAPRQLTDAGYLCYAHHRVPVAYCVTNMVSDGFTPNELDVTAGSIAEPTGPHLARIERVKVTRKDYDRGFWSTMSEAGDLVIYSAPRAPDFTAASLRTARIAEAGTTPPQEILPDVMFWGLANDEKKVYYLSKYANRAGTLMMADFPTGANPVQLARRTSRYVTLGEDTADDRGVGYFVDGTGRFLSEFRIIPSRDQPTSSATVFRYPGGLLDFRPSKDLRYVGYARNDSYFGQNGYLVRRSDGFECVLNSERGRPAFFPRFLTSSGLVFWLEESYDDFTRRDGWVGNPDGCQDKRRYGSRIGLYTVLRDEGLIFGDDFDDETVTLRYAHVPDGRTWPQAGPVRVREKVALPLVMLEGTGAQLVFRVASGDPAVDGLYYQGGLPFGMRPVGDASAEADAGADSRTSD